MMRTNLPLEIWIHIATYLEPDACYRLIQAFEGLSLVLPHKDLIKKARNTAGDTIVHLAARRGDVKLIQNLLARSVNIHVRNKRGVTPLAEAALRGHQAVVELLISAGAKIDEPDSRGFFPLHAAAYRGSDAVVQVLIDAGANVLQSIPFHRTALHMAIRTGHLSTVSMLLNKMKSHPDMADIHVYSGVLDLAAEYGHTHVFHKLVEAGFEFTANTLRLAASLGRAKIARILLSLSSFPMQLRHEVLIKSAMLGYHSVVKVLMGSDFDISHSNIVLSDTVGSSGSLKVLRLLEHAGFNLEWGTILYFAAKGGHAAMVAYVAGSKRVDHRNYTSALYNSATAGHHAVVKVLLESGAKLDEDEKRSALASACEKGSLAIHDLLVEPGDRFNIQALYPAVCAGDSERTAAILNRKIDTSTLDRPTNIRLQRCLKKAAENGNTVIVKLLLNAGIAPDYAYSHARWGYWARSALEWAARGGHLEVVDVLVKAGADLARENRLNFRNSSTFGQKGYTALYVAAGAGHVAVTKYLISCGACVSFQGEEGHTALHQVARVGHIAIVKLLIKAGADLSIQARCGATPLYYAALYNRVEIVELLLNAGSDPSILDLQGRSALSRASEFGHTEVVSLLTAAHNGH
ncbi:hypothetical protein N7466_003137 [Penicillium verhagenii]|uniref:uncharacterized protein n=1 Tax=Penicillium verhagenii TaxID=1562060 RepID=UPI0025450472|nr:uncharacterized protein N7466_003137 [Penicillium verhagenii]KAJ5936687.1 hypothetical protein N7466_003137 [Penicillium verhagenii]